MDISTIATTPYADQKPGTSGLRKNTQVFLTKPNYTENFIQSILLSLDQSVLPGCTLVVGGDGRYYMDTAVELICQLAAANGVGRLIIGESGILSTPAVSCLIRKHAAAGGIILTASHNPGGPHADFGIKFNAANGGPASSAVTDRIFEISRALTEYRSCKELKVPFGQVGSHRYQAAGVKHELRVDVVSSVDDYVLLMREIFDFDQIRAYVAAEKVAVLFDSLHGVMGPYARRIALEIGADPAAAAANAVPKPDFGGGHPDPNLTYARELVAVMERGEHDLGVAFDGDGDRNMIIGRDGFFVSPCDSLAVIAANCRCIPYFRERALTGFARSTVPLDLAPLWFSFLSYLLSSNIHRLPFETYDQN